MWSVGAALSLCALLLACGQTKTQEYYLAHPEEIASDLAQCKRQGEHTYNCNEAARAQFFLQHSAQP